MAAVAEGRNDAGIYWIKDTSEDEQAGVSGPGLSEKMGLKSTSMNGHEGKVKGRAECKLKSWKKITDVSMAKPPLQKTVTPPQMVQQAQELFLRPLAKSKASLKDLCPEDKRRIANLIEELARVSEEKEESVQRLRDEQETFEKKIQQLEEQNQLIVQERESLQQQYQECQELLGLYQEYLSQQQDKLNKSIAQMNHSHSHCKMASSERKLSRACGRRATHLDGSYLGPASCRRTACTHTFRAGPPSMPSCCSQQECVSNERGAAGAKNCAQGGWSELVPDTHSKTEAAGGSLGATEPSHSPKNEPECDAARREMRPPGDRQDWEEKRQRLLLQKKQLEVERERLQARLAQQEERLLKQNQELRESQLNYSKIHQAATELEQAFNGLALNTDARARASGETQSVLREGGLQALKGSIRQPVNDVQPQTRDGNLQPSEPRISCEVSTTTTKKDMATSPVHSQSFQKSSPPPLPLSYPRTPNPSKLDASLIDLLDVFSPVENADRSRRISAAHRSLAGPYQTLSGVRTSRLSPRGQTWVSQEELQESQILEDIFFIC